MNFSQKDTSATAIETNLKQDAAVFRSDSLTVSNVPFTVGKDMFTRVVDTCFKWSIVNILCKIRKTRSVSFHCIRNQHKII